MRRHNGFTLLEMMLSVAMMMLLLGISAPIYGSYTSNSSLSDAEAVVKTILLQAKTNALAGELDDSWGVHVASGEVTLFKGADYATRNSSFDIPTKISSGITVSGLSEVYFSVVTGEPSATGSVTLTSVENRTATITINDVGIISY